MNHPVDSPKTPWLERSGRPFGAARVAVLGVNLWAVAVAAPMVLASPRDPLVAALLVLAPLLPLSLGVGLCRYARTPARVVLLALYPATVGLAVTMLPSMVADPPHSTVGLVLAALSLLAYGAGAVLAVDRPDERPILGRRPLGRVKPFEESRRRRITRHLLLATCFIGAFVIAVVAPSLGGDAALHAAWGVAAPEAGVLVAVAAGGIASGSLALLLAPAMRASRARAPSRSNVRMRVGLLSLVVVAGAALLFLLER